MRNIFKWTVFAALLASGMVAGAEITLASETSKSPDWVIAIGHIAADVLPVIEVVIAGLVGVLVKKLTTKYHLDGVINTQTIVDDAVQKAISYAEVWAEKQSTTPTGSDKMNVALGFIDTTLKNQAVQNFEREHLSKLVEHFLSQQDAPAAQANPAT